MVNYPSLIIIASCYLVYRTSGKLIRRYFVSKLTVLNELSDLDRKSTKKLYGTAVICGGSIAGLLTAKVCSYHFEDVIMVESEKWITSPDNIWKPKEEILKQKRSHVAQYYATHMQLTLLAATLLKWFPNLKEESEKLGGRLIPYTQPVSYSGKMLIVPSYPSDQVPFTVSMRRRVFEPLVRRLVMDSCKNVRYVSGTVVGLEKSPNSNTLTGVHIHTSEKEDTILSADLVVDCTGSAFAGLRWLKALATSDQASKQLDNLRITYNPKQSYHSCEFDISDELEKQLEEHGFPTTWPIHNALYAVLPDPKMDNKIMGIMRRDKNTLEILFGGWAVTEEIANYDDIKSYISNMKLYKPLPAWIMETINLLEESDAPLRIDKARLGISAFIRYHLYDNIPSNFIAIGDSVMTVNPIKGFGTTKACIGALALSGILDSCTKANQHRLPDDFSRRFFKRQAECIEPEWTSYKADDYAWETTTPSKGDDPQTFAKFQRSFGRILLELLCKEGYNDVAATAGYVGNYLAPATDLFSPNVLWKVIRFKLFG